MPTLLSHTTALEVLRSVTLKRALERGERASAPLPERSPSRAEIGAVLERFPRLTLPIHVCATRQGHVVSPQLARVHRSRVALPAGSTIRLTDEVFCSSPEHLVVQDNLNIVSTEYQILFAGNLKKKLDILRSLIIL